MQDITLPELRAELALLRGAPTATGAPTWLIHDPVQGRFLQIDGAAYHALAHWRTCRSADELASRAAADDSYAITAEQIGQLIGFLEAQKLTTEPARGGWRHFAAERARSRHSVLALLVHNYLFFRVPLWRPAGFLAKTMPLALLVASRPAWVLYWVLSIAGLYLASREWDLVAQTLLPPTTWEGIALIAVSIGVVKLAHELGHAYVAAGFGCRVPTMGIAFMLLAPLPYTDVTDAWRLRDRSKRIAIDSAGIKVEAVIAGLALFLWAFLPLGAAKTAMATIAAVGLVSTLLVNLNPFMRFDGYYLLAEHLAIENLQPRAFDLGVWKLREVILGLGQPPPEVLPRRRVATLVAYAWATWVYRLLLFVAIALVVYHYFFKLLGIVLFAIEIIYFVARPVMGELKVWWRMRSAIVRSRRAAISAVVMCGGLFIAALPWSTRIEIPAVLEADRTQQVHAPRVALVKMLHVVAGQSVSEGMPLATLAAPDIDREIDIQRSRLRLAELQYARRGASSADREASLVLETTIASLKSRIAGLEEEQDLLILRAPFAGEIREFEPELHAGRWVAPRQPLMTITRGHGLVIRGYVAEADVRRIAPGDRGKFIPDHAQRPVLRLRVEDIAVGAAAAIEIADLSATHSGRIGVSLDERRRDVPTIAHYLVRMTVLDDLVPADLSVRGIVIVEGAAESPLARLWRSALKVIIRESGL
ncbi:MAG TPA: HlyD family efflux transporter periplasmic adaptor subunit [Hyphomicrobiaceae bacterium]|nr:HlyD family efflux transporter periplasmic adaptor subunit [Hyphomicrobiaceae bacterium]